jgi:hypothetical protein
MRETRQPGSEGGGVGTTGAPYPYHDFPLRNAAKSWMAGRSMPPGT